MVDSIVVQSAVDNKEDPKHIEEMVNKVDAAETALKEELGPADGKDARPEWLPENFKTPEDMAKAYAELEGKLGGGKQGGEKTTGTDATKEKPEDVKKGAEGDPAAAEVLEEKGLSMDEFSQEFADKGALSTESYEKLAKAGITKTVVDQYIAGQQAIATQLQAEVKAVVGGPEEFAAMAAWAQANVPVVDLEAYNRAVSSGDVAQAKLAVAGLNQRYRESNPTEPNLVNGSNGKVTADVYESIAQMQADMSKPEYKKDPAFRRKVQEKLGRSDIL